MEGVPVPGPGWWWWWWFLQSSLFLSFFRVHHVCSHVPIVWRFSCFSPGVAVVIMTNCQLQGCVQPGIQGCKTYEKVSPMRQ
eukprot:2031715-Pyramimonas_sp.AAC.1